MGWREYERCGMGSRANGVNCGVVEWGKRNTLRWFGHIERMGSVEFVKKVYMSESVGPIERMGSEEFVKKVYMSESVGPNSRGRSPGRWMDRLKEYMCERCYHGRRVGSSKEGVLEQGEVDTFLPWPPSWGTLLEEARHQS